MQVGAVILAAGKNSDFRPTLELSGSTVIQKEITMLREAAISPIVVVTGYESDVLEKHLAHRNVIFVKNESYEETRMIESIKLGLKALKEKCEKAVLIPVDMPVFESTTIRKVVESAGDVVIPCDREKTGHPVSILMSKADIIITYDGDDGLRGAIKSGKLDVHMCQVDDPGIFIAGKTEKDYDEILDYYKEKRDSMPVTARVKVSLVREKNFFDMEAVEFLETIDRLGSMNAACHKMKIAYSRGWKMINIAEEEVGDVLINRQIGGAKGGSSRLTETGKAYIGKYLELKEKIESYSEKVFKDIFS